MSIYTKTEDELFSSLKHFDSSDAITEPVGYDPVWNECIRLGGITQGNINKQNGHIQAIQKMLNMHEVGRLGGIATVASGKGAVGDPEQRLQSQKAGGRVQGKRNVDSGHCKRISQEYWAKVRRGEIIRAKRLKKD